MKKVVLSVFNIWYGTLLCFYGVFTQYGLVLVCLQ